MRQAIDRIPEVENATHRWLVRHSVMLLRVAVGAVLLGFGLLKYFPGASPAEDLVMTTVDVLTFGLVSPRLGLVTVATLECAIGLLLLADRGMRVAIGLVALDLVGVLSPLVLTPDRLFTGWTPTLEGQYVLKDVILVAAVLVIAATSFRGGRITRDEPVAATRPRPASGARPLDHEEQLGLVLEGERDDRSVAEICREHGISELDYHRWRDRALAAASSALAEEPPVAPGR